MDGETVQNRLVRAILAADMNASVRLEGDCRVNVGLLSIQVHVDRLTIGPGVTHLSPEQVKLLRDPESLLWFVARFDDPDFAGRVARFLQKKGVNLLADWLET